MLGQFKLWRVVALLALLALIFAAVLLPVFSRGRAKAHQGPGPGSPPAAEMMMEAAEGTMAPGAGMAAGSLPGGGPAPGAMTAEAEAPVDASAPRQAIDKNAYYSSTYMAGSGERDRLEKLISQGVTVGGKNVKLAAFTREYSQSLELPSKEALSVNVALERGKLPKAGDEVHLQVGLQAIKREAPRRPPINLCLVIDRSGSMMDENKINFARQAALSVIAGLKSTDNLGIVAYDDVIQILRESSPRGDGTAARKAVDTLQPGGATNILDGLKEGYRQVQKRFSADSINQVILVSDGVVTAGLDDVNAFRELASKMADEDIQTTAVGMGMEFDERLMSAIAQSGRGGYHFIKDAAQTVEVFEKELGQLTQVVAKGVKLRIVLPKDVELVRVLGSQALSAEESRATRATEQRIDRRAYEELGITPDRAEPDEPGIKMLFPHFYSGDSHVVILKIRVPKGTKSRDVAQVEVKYKDLVFRANRKVDMPARAGYAKDKAESIASVNRSVKKNVLGFQTGEALLQAAEYLNAGRTRDAVQVIDEQMALLGVAARQWKDTDLDRDGRLLSAYQQVLVAQGSNSLAGTDLGNYLAKSFSYSGHELTR